MFSQNFKTVCSWKLALTIFFNSPMKMSFIKENFLYEGKQI